MQLVQKQLLTADQYAQKISLPPLQAKALHLARQYYPT